MSFGRKQTLHTCHAQCFLSDAHEQSELDNSLHLSGLEDNLNASCLAPRFNTLQDSLRICYIATFGVLTFIIPPGP